MAPLTWAPVWASQLPSCLYLPPPLLHMQAVGCTPHPEPQAGSLSLPTGSHNRVLPTAGSYAVHTCPNLVKSLLCCNFRVHLSPRTRSLHPGEDAEHCSWVLPRGLTDLPRELLESRCPAAHTHKHTHTHTHTGLLRPLLEKEKHSRLCRPRVWRREEEGMGSPQGQGEGQLTWRVLYS